MNKSANCLSLGDRMKRNYENISRHYLMRRVPVIIRLDGKAFHTLTQDLKKPFDSDFRDAMEKTAIKLISEIQGAKFAYVQSDEISILVTDYDNLETDAWFAYNIQKMVSISAAVASVTFSNSFHKHPAYFDSRAFNISREEVVNYFIWRQLDWIRNSIQMHAQSLYLHNELIGKKEDELHQLIFLKGENWNNNEPRFKNGSAVNGLRVVSPMPDLRKNLNYVRYLNDLVNCDCE